MKYFKYTMAHIFLFSAGNGQIFATENNATEDADVTNGTSVDTVAKKSKYSDNYQQYRDKINEQRKAADGNGLFQVAGKAIYMGAEDLLQGIVGRAQDARSAGLAIWNTAVNLAKGDKKLAAEAVKELGTIVGGMANSVRLGVQEAVILAQSVQGTNLYKLFGSSGTAYTMAGKVKSVVNGSGTSASAGNGEAGTGDQAGATPPNEVY
jgi:hypothetical protein